jgi:hypothetical protein
MTPRKKGKGIQKKERKQEGRMGGGRRRNVCSLSLCKENGHEQESTGGLASLGLRGHKLLREGKKNRVGLSVFLVTDSPSSF